MRDEKWVLERRQELVRERDQNQLVLDEEYDDPDELGGSAAEQYWDGRAHIDCIDAKIAILEEVLEFGKQ